MRDGCAYAGVSDLDNLVELAREFHEESPFADRRFSPQGAREYLAEFIKSHNAILIIGHGGAIGASWSESRIFHGRVVNEAFWYGGGLTLLREYMDWCERVGACGDVMGLMDNSKVDSERLLRVLEKFGYTIHERTLVRRRR